MFWWTMAVDHREATRAVGDHEVATARAEHPPPDAAAAADDDAGVVEMAATHATNKRRAIARRGRADRKQEAKTAKK